MNHDELAQGIVDNHLDGVTETEDVKIILRKIIKKMGLEKKLSIFSAKD